LVFAAQQGTAKLTVNLPTHEEKVYRYPIEEKVPVSLKIDGGYECGLSYAKSVSDGFFYLSIACQDSHIKASLVGASTTVKCGSLAVLGLSRSKSYDSAPSKIENTTVFISCD
jgi:hypothetical protein